MEKRNAPPRAKLLIQSLRGLGYSPETAIADLIDNSISADATEVHISIRAKDAEHPPYICIVDNGRGMDREELVEAMRYASETEHDGDSLGKFGLGLKTASLSQCQRLLVSSKPKAARGTKPRRAYACWDLPHVFKVNEWELLLPKPEQLEPWEANALAREIGDDGGTVILWTELSESLKGLSAADSAARAQFLADLLENQVKPYLRGAFHLFMQGKVPNRRKLKILLEGRPLKPWDPFCTEEDTWELDPYRPTSTELSGHGKPKVVFQPYVLPQKAEFTDPKGFNEASGPKGWNLQQGFYFYRNHRLIQSGGWSNLRKPDEHGKLLRVAVHFDGDYDEPFEINITKMRAYVPAPLRTSLRNCIQKWGREANKRYRKKDEGSAKKSATKAASSDAAVQNQGAYKFGSVTVQAANTQSGQVQFPKQTQPGQFKILVPQNHDMAEIFESKTGDLMKLAWTLYSALEGMVAGTIRANSVPLESFRRKLRSLK